MLIIIMALSAPAATNLMVNPGAETVLPVDQASKTAIWCAKPSEHYPPGWGFYRHHPEKTEWGATDREAHSGRFSAFLRFTDYGAANSNFNSDSTLFFADCDIFTGGSNAIPVKPNSAYAISFWLKVRPVLKSSSACPSRIIKSSVKACLADNGRISKTG